MPVIQSYESMTVELMNATPYPAEITALALSITMSTSDTDIPPTFTQKKAEFIVDAEHDSVFEHVNYTFLIQGISRSLLAQLTRQRTASPTSGSQHYQDYSGYPASISSYCADEVMLESLDHSFKAYGELIDMGIPREEARQVLPNAACVNFLWTIDARNLFKFLRQRLCHRNVEEMQVFATKTYTLVKEHFPELFSLAGPQCYKGTCKQGHLRCIKGEWEPTWIQI